MGSPQLAEQHGYKLAPGTEASGVTLGPGFLDHPLEFQTREQLQQLTEDTTILIHSWALLWFSFVHNFYTKLGLNCKT